MSNKKDIQKFVAGVPGGLEIVNTGSTFALHGFDYVYFDKRGFNFALAPQPMSYDYKILNQYKSSINKNAVVVIVVCPFAFCVPDYESDDNNYKYYHFLDKGNIIGYTRKKEFYLKFCPLILKPDYAVTKVKSVVKSIMKHVRKRRRISQDYIKKSAMARIGDWKEEFGLSNTSDCEPDEQLKAAFKITTDYLRKMLDICAENGFRPVIINMPACKEESDEFSDEFIERFYNQNVRNANIYNAPVIDYFRDSRLHDHSLYMNADCLNEKGRRYFAEVLTDDLGKLGLWE